MQCRLAVSTHVPWNHPEEVLRQESSTHLAKVRLGHSPFLVPDLRDQFLVTLAQGWLLVCAYQATTLQEELSERGAGLEVESQDRREKEGTVI